MKRVGIESNTTQAPGPIRRRWTFRLHGSRAGKTRCWISATSASSQTLCRPTKPTRRSVHQDCPVRSGCCNRTASEPLFQLEHNDGFGRQVQSQIRARDLVGRERCGLNRARIVERVHGVHRLRGEDLPGELAAIKSAVAGDILVAGSARLVQSLAEDDLVDEYRLMVFPVVLGSGKRLFAAGMPHTVLRLTDSKPLGPDGVVLLTYAPARGASTEG